MKTNGRMQLFPVLRIVLFLAAGIVAGERLYGVVSVDFWFCALVVSLLFVFLLRKNGVAQTVGLFLANLFLGGCLASYSMSRVDVDFADSEVKYSAVVVSPPVVVGKTVRCDLLLADRSRPLKIRASFYRDRRAELLKAGDGVEVSSVLERPQNFWASDFDYRSYLLRHGFAGTTFIYITDWRGAPVSLEALSYLERVKIAALKFRNTLLSKLKAMGVGGQDYAVLAAMTLGERVAISDQLNDDYSVSGALHVLSLSGLHLSIIYAMLSFLFFRWRRSVVAQALVVCAVWAYVFVAGLPVSAVRSAVMLTVYSFVSLLNRDRMSLNTLAVAALVVLLSSPLSFYDVGFQMSFVSVLFIILLYRPLYSLMPRKAAEVPVVRWVWGMIVVSVAAQVGVAPLVAFYFGRFSCYFILTNFIVIPASTVILYGVVLMALVFFWPWFQAVVCAVLVKVVAFMNAGVTWVASLPGAGIDGIRLNLAQLAMVYVAVFSLYVLSFYVRKMRWQRLV